MKYLLLSVVLVMAAALIVWAFFLHRSAPAPIVSKRVLLLGASVGYAWDFPAWPARTASAGYVAEMVPFYAFDKTEALDEILMRPKRKIRLTRTYIKGLFSPAPVKPDVIIIKECAAYFPGDLPAYKAVIEQMVSRCAAAGIRPVLATVVPVTDKHELEKRGRLAAIIEYNDWIKSYAQQNGLQCLDLESAVRISAANRALRESFTSGDGLHLNAEAYRALDTFLKGTIDTLFA